MPGSTGWRARIGGARGSVARQSGTWRGAPRRAPIRYP
ncbi:MAG: hypothetical protein AVDCRST_MAG49-285 [uncultured Thermomicrobiales bacterium]|uniref:Uncharacterized protein n=1 Tax=uncultured Thermomicrobiales bacterium TaxID=1645740 RepID=A0A6J4U2D9_9BACT|nr:MAG: hypothetical protein AVDCRST_MAG49-285 [uncultured Thermomicrobiales bacterium]